MPPRPAGHLGRGEDELGALPLALFKALLLATWHALSDVRLAENVRRREFTPGAAARAAQS